MQRKIKYSTNNGLKSLQNFIYLFVLFGGVGRVGSEEDRVL